MQGYADSHQIKRLKKAQKIAFLVGDITGLDVLDLGAGAGMMADYFASLGARVTAADRDQSQFVSELPFAKIEGQTLPLASASFDVVIFNHVIEHVGESPQQNAMVEEIARVLRDDGRLYFAAPSKWALVEPHFRLPLLGALPRGVADEFVRLRGAKEYDCYPLSPSGMERLLQAHFISVEDVSSKAFAWAAQNELTGPARAVGMIPASLLAPIFPTRMYIAKGKRPVGR